MGRRIDGNEEGVVKKWKGGKEKSEVGGRNGRTAMVGGNCLKEWKGGKEVGCREKQELENWMQARTRRRNAGVVQNEEQKE